MLPVATYKQREKLNGHINLRISILNTPSDLSPLKMRGWLLDQAREIQESSGENAYVKIRLVLTKRQRYAFTQKKLDQLLQGIVDKFSAIHGVELAVVEKELTQGELDAIAADANAELTEMHQSLEKAFGKSEGQAKP